MPIFSNIASTLARQGPKTFTHGYAQSLIAATHPQVYVSHNRPGFGLHRTSKSSLLSTYNLQNAFHNSLQSSGATIQLRIEKCEGGLDAYFEAWRKIHANGEPEKEWTQFQFAKRIEWKPNSIGVDSEVPSDLESGASQNSLSLERSINFPSKKEDNQEISVADERKTLEEKINVCFDIEKESSQAKAVFEEVTVNEEVSYTDSALTASSLSSLSLDQTPSEANVENSSLSTAPILSSPENQSQTYAEHLKKLSDAQRYVEIPAVFEAMLVAGIHPTASAYNALLDAAVHLPSERINIVPKALDIYSDMLKRKVQPDTATYDALLQLLSSRFIEVHSLKQSLDEKRVRFGGIDEQGKFMFTSSELEFAILSEDDRIDLAIQLFNESTRCLEGRLFSSTTYHQLIVASSLASRTTEMNKIYEHMRKTDVLPLGSTFPYMVDALAKVGDLSTAVDRYNEYKDMAIKHDKGLIDMIDRQDDLVYASLIRAYVKLDRLPGAVKFYNKITETYSSRATSLIETVVGKGFIQGHLERGMLREALGWAEKLPTPAKINASARISTAAADIGDKLTATEAFSLVPHVFPDIVSPSMAMMALSVREGNVPAAQFYWQILSHPEISVTSAFIEPTAMLAVAMIGSGQIVEGLNLAEEMFSRIRSYAVDTTGFLNDEVEEGLEFVRKFMSTRGILDPRITLSEIPKIQGFSVPSYQAPIIGEGNFDPYAKLTDFKGSAVISDILEKVSSRGKSYRFVDAFNRLENIRRNGQHPRYITYAKLISAAAREGQGQFAHEIFNMARNDVPLQHQYSAVRHGWVLILDAMIGACLNLGDRNLAAQYHQEILSLGAAPSANTFGLYITTLKGSTQTFDEAADAVKIFHRAKIEGVEPSSFLYNALIGKLGKARRIDDCLFYFAEMRNLGIRPTSVTYGTIVNALCRVSDEKLAVELFEEMESMPNYKPRPAPYNSLMQFYLTTKHKKNKVLSYFERMKVKGIKPTNHTYKLLIDAHATLEPINMAAAEAVFDVIRSTGQEPEAAHYSSLIHAKGCVLHDVEGAKKVFDSVMSDTSIRPQPCLYQALFEAMVANNSVHLTEPLLKEMPGKGIEMTPYIANALIQGWTSEKNIERAKDIFSMVALEKREPSTYEAMTRAYLATNDRLSANSIVQEMLSRNYPGAVSNKICELLGSSSIQNLS